jgi:hypothetical protein
MKSKSLALTALVASLTMTASPVLAQRGGRGGGGGMQRGGGGGMQRGGYGGGGGDMQRGGYGGSGMQRGGYGGSGMQRGGYGGSPEAGGFGGGFSSRGMEGGSPREGAGMGPYGSAGNAGRPGYGAGGVGGPASGVGALPGAGAGRAGTPGAYGAGAYGAARYGTYYAGDAALYSQRNAMVAGAGAYPTYNAGMYGGYPNAWPPTNMTSPSLYTNPGYGAVAGQLGMGQQPTPYDYGSNVIAQPNAVYVNGENVGTPQQYAAAARRLAAGGNAQPPADSRWQPLGIFAMSDGGQGNPLGIVQLAVNAQGTIRGNFHDMNSDAVSPIAGAVDPQTQRAAWSIGGQKAPIYEAGIANLTKDQTTMLAHTSEGQQQQFSLLRLPEPPQGGGGGNAPPAGGQ